MILPCQSLHVFISSFLTLLCVIYTYTRTQRYIHTHTHTYIPNSDVTLLPCLWLSSKSASPLPTALSWGWNTVHWSNNQPSSTGHLFFPMGLPQGSSWLERAMTGRRKHWALAWQHREVPVTSCRRKLYSPPEALLRLKTLSTGETAGTDVLRSIIWILFVHYILQ